MNGFNESPCFLHYSRSGKGINAYYTRKEKPPKRLQPKRTSRTATASNRLSLPLPPHPLPLRVVHWPQANLRRTLLPRHLDLVSRGQHIVGGFVGAAAHVAEAGGGAEVVAVGAGGDVAGDAAVAPDRLVVVEQRLRVREPELQQAAREARLALLQHRVAADEGAEAGGRFLGLHREAEAGPPHVETGKAWVREGGWQCG